MKYILSAIAVAGLAVAPASAGETYISVFGGAGFLQDDAFSAFALQPDFETGAVYGAALGKGFDAPIIGRLRFEAEVARRNNDGSRTVDVVSVNGDQTAWSLMANAVYDAELLGGLVKPYAGVGVGAAWVKADLVVESPLIICLDPYCLGSADETDAVFAWQLIGGAAVDVAPRVELYTEGRWFDAGDTAFDGKPGFFGPPTFTQSEYQHGSVLFGIRLDL